MTEIDIERKERKPWPWIIGLLILVLIVWGVAEMASTDDAEIATVDPLEEIAPQPEPGPGPTGEDSPASQFAAWVRDSAQTPNQMGREHEYTREGIRRMAGAIETLVQQDTAPQVQQSVQTLRQQATAIQQSPPESPEHAGQARQAFTTAVEIMQDLARRPHLQQANLDESLNAARSALDRIDAGTPLLEQREAVHEFFDRMAHAIQRAQERQSQR